VLSSAPSREKRKSRCAEIRSKKKEEKADSWRTKKGGVKRSPMAEEVHSEHDGRRKKQSLLYPVFQMESSKPNTSYLSVPRPKGKADEGTAEIASRS